MFANAALTFLIATFTCIQAQKDPDSFIERKDKLISVMYNSGQYSVVQGFYWDSGVLLSNQEFIFGNQTAALFANMSGVFKSIYLAPWQVVEEDGSSGVFHELGNLTAEVADVQEDDEIHGHYYCRWSSRGEGIHENVYIETDIMSVGMPEKLKKVDDVKRSLEATNKSTLGKDSIQDRENILAGHINDANYEAVTEMYSSSAMFLTPVPDQFHYTSEIAGYWRTFHAVILHGANVSFTTLHVYMESPQVAHEVGVMKCSECDFPALTYYKRWVRGDGEFVIEFNVMSTN